MQQVVQCPDTTLGSHAVNQFARHRSTVKSGATEACKSRQGSREIRLYNSISLIRDLVILQKNISRLRVILQCRQSKLCQLAVMRIDHKACARQLDGRLQTAGKRQAPVVTGNVVQRGRFTGNPGRQHTFHRQSRHYLTRGIQIHITAGGQRSLFAAIHHYFKAVTRPVQ